MGPSLHFLGTGKGESIRGTLSEGGFLIRTAKATVLVNPGPGAAQGLGALKIREVDAIVIGDPSRAHDANLVKAGRVITENADVKGIQVIKKESGFQFKIPDGAITYVTDEIKLKDMKQYACEVMVLDAHGQDEQLILKIQPRLAILTGYDLSYYNRKPVYLARELQKSTGVQTIAAKDDMTVDLYSYGALAEQKSLSKF